MPALFEGNELLGLIDRMRAAFVGRDEIVQRGADAYRASDITGINNGVVTPMSFSGVIKDTDGLWSGAAPTRLTAKIQGWYVCTAGAAAQFTSGTASGVECIMQIRLNGSNAIAANNAFTVAGLNVYINVGRVIYLNSGDYIEGLFQHNGASSVMKIFGGFLYTPQLSMIRYP